MKTIQDEARNLTIEEITKLEADTIGISFFAKGSPLPFRDDESPTKYQNLLATLYFDENMSYSQTPDDGHKPVVNLATNGKPSDNQTGDNLATEVRLGKDRIDKVSIVRHKHGEYQNVLLTDEEMEKLKTEFPNDYQQRIERLSEYIASTGKRYKNHLATIRSWARKDKPREEKPPVYDSSTNKDMSADDEAELLRLMKGEQ